MSYRRYGLYASLFIRVPAQILFSGKYKGSNQVHATKRPYWTRAQSGMGRRPNKEVCRKEALSAARVCKVKWNTREDVKRRKKKGRKRMKGRHTRSPIKGKVRILSEAPPWINVEETGG